MDKKKLGDVLRRAERLCIERGARLTTQRRTVLELLCASDKPLSAYEILDRMRTTTRNPAPPMRNQIRGFMSFLLGMSV